MARPTTPRPEDGGATPPAQYPPPAGAATAGTDYQNQQPYPPPAGVDTVGTYGQQQQYPPPSPRPQLPTAPPVSPHHVMHQQEQQYYYPPNSKPSVGGPIGGGIPMQPVGNYSGSGYSAQASVVQPGIPVGVLVQPATPGYQGVRPMVPHMGTEQWTTGLFDCMDDPTLAFTTFLAPCVTFGQIAEIIDNGQTTCGTSGTIYGAVLLVIGMPCLMSCGYRTRLRAKYDLIEAPAPDWITHFFFECCALAQEYRELRNRGLDPAIGWYANMARLQNAQQGMMTPPMQQTMM